MSDIRLIALDLDGTLFNAEKEVTAANRQAILEAKKKDVKVVITTGRPLAAIGNLLDHLGLLSDDDYSITFNGGLVQKNTGQVLSKKCLSLDEIQQIQSTLEPLALPVDILSDDLVYSLASQGKHSDYPQANPLLSFREILSLDQLPIDRDYNKIVTVCDQDYLDQRLDQLPKHLYQQFDAFKSREIIFEIMPKGVNKAAGLEILCQRLGISRQQVMALGDEANDVSMLKWAGLGLAMANATPLAQAAADIVIKYSNENSGVARAISQYVL